MLDTNFPTQAQMNAFGHFLNTTVALLPRLLLAGVLIVAGLFIAATLGITMLRVLDLRRLLRQEMILLELTPPAILERSPLANQKLISILHGLEETRTWLDKRLRRKVVFAPEIAASREGGIRYLIRIPASARLSFETDLASYLPEIKFAEVAEYLPNASIISQAKVLEFRQTRSFAYPLRTDDFLIDQDPVAYVTGSMTKLKPDEMMVLQMVASPTVIPKSDQLAGKILHSEVRLHSLDKHNRPSMMPVLSGVSSALFSITDTVGDVAHGPSLTTTNNHVVNGHHDRQVASGQRPARTLGPIEQPLAQAVYDKLSQNLFRVSIRVMVITASQESETSRLSSMRKALGSFSEPKYQSLKIRHNFFYALRAPYRAYKFSHRLPALFDRNNCVLSASEIAAIYHFPDGVNAKPENMITSLSKTLPAPTTLKRRADNGNFDVVLGTNIHHGEQTSIGLTAAERERHVYIIGGTGNGKTTMMEYAIVQDIQNGKGVAVIDPHGDLAEKLLRYIPENRINDVIYFNPSDLGYPIALNLLEIPEGLSGDELLDAKDFITEAVISIMRKVFSKDDTGGHRIEYILRNTVQTALTVEGATLFTVFDLLTDGKYLRKVIKTLEDQKLKNFWKNEFGKAGDFQQVKMAAGVTAKIGRFQFSASAERILSQSKSTINFEEILDGKILICNFAKGLIGEDTSELFGISTLAKLQLAAYRRVKQKRADRKPFFIYVDEFQNFATMSFVQLLSEARKYKVFMTMAEQSTSQQDDQSMVNTILANVGTVICFRSGNPADEVAMLPLFTPYIQEGEIANLPSYNFYARISAVLSQEPMSGETLLLKDSGSEAVLRATINAARANYARQYRSIIQATNAKASAIRQKSNIPAAVKQTTALPGD
jgi:hypothetical protein